MAEIIGDEDEQKFNPITGKTHPVGMTEGGAKTEGAADTTNAGANPEGQLEEGSAGSGD